MIPHPEPLQQALLGTAAGLAGGGLFFLVLRRNVRLYLGGGPAWQPLLLHLVRLAALVLLLVATARQGGVALLAMFGGILLARRLVLRWAESRP